MNHKKYFAVILLAIIIFNLSAPLSLAYDKTKDEWLGEDKALYFSVSCGLDVVTYNYYIKNTDYSNDQAEVAAFVTTLAIGFLKEFIDEKFSWKDIVADALGAGLGKGLSIEF